MGKTIRSGFAHGLSQAAAERSFVDSLNKTYGEESYQGGGNDITEWLSAECIEKPVVAETPKQAKSLKFSELSSGKLVNGFHITNETPELVRLQISAQYNTHIVVPDVVDDFALTLTEARKKAGQMAMKLNAKVHVLPKRLWQDEKSKRLSIPVRVLEVSPVGGKGTKQGKWRFQVEVRI